jgi:hypothetical protein
VAQAKPLTALQRCQRSTGTTGPATALAVAGSAEVSKPMIATAAAPGSNQLLRAVVGAQLPLFEPDTID